jgi:pyruvate ferredoxin oxidoreductase gamma subunit
MHEVRFHGRGGQGAVTAAELLSIAAFEAGSRAQAFPSFGSERTGAPVAAFCRIDTRPIRLREPVLEPDTVIIFDTTLLHAVDVFAGLKPDGKVLVNSASRPQELGLDDLTDRCPGVQVISIPASEIARRHFGRPLPNGVMLGGFAALTGQVSIAGVQKALRDRFPGSVGEANAAAAAEAFELVAAATLEAVDA